MNRRINYIDLFSGIGGFALGLKKAGFIFENHWFSEINKNAINIYKNIFQKQRSWAMSRQLEMFQDCVPTLSLSASLAKICRMLESGQVWQALEAICSLKRSGLSGKLSLSVLSLRTSKAFYL